MAEDYVNFLSSHAVPRAMTLVELQEATKADKTLQHLVQVIRAGDWSKIDKTQLKQFARVKEDLTVTDKADLILCGNCIVIPTVLQQRAVEIAHEGHQGIVKTKTLLREKVWFPGIDAMVKAAIQNCIACQANGTLNVCAATTTMAYRSVDFCGPFPTGEYLLVLIDGYSRFPEVEIVNSTAGKGTILKLD